MIEMNFITIFVLLFVIQSGNAAISESKYRVKLYVVQTEGAEINADIYITLIGDKRNCDEAQLTSHSLKLTPIISAGSVTEFPVTCYDIGTLMSVVIRHQDPPLEDWFLNKITVKDPKFNEELTFPYGKWLSGTGFYPVMSAELFVWKGPQETLPDKEIKITFRTSGHPDAGTEASVYVTLIGSLERVCGDTEIWHLPFGVRFTPFSEVTQTIICPDLGSIERIRVRHDNGLNNSSWSIETIIVQMVAEKKSVVFHVGRWLSESSDSGEICEDFSNPHVIFRKGDTEVLEDIQIADQNDE